MTPRQRFECALNFQEADRVPWTPFFTAAARRVYGAPYAHYAQWGDTAAKCQIQSQQLFGFDVLCAGADPFCEAAGFGCKVLFPEEEAPHPAPGPARITAPDDYAGLTAYDPLQDGTRTKDLLECCDILMNERGAELPVVAKINSPLAVLAALRSTDTLLQDCKSCPEALRPGLAAVAECLGAFAKALAANGALVMFAVPFAAGEMLPREVWQGLEGPFLSQLAEIVRQSGSAAAVQAVHRLPYLDALAETVAPVLMAVEHLPDGCADWTEVKEQLAGKAALWCGLSLDLLDAGESEAIDAECRQKMSTLSPGGGYVLAPGREFPDNANLRSVQILRNAVAQYGVDPQ